MSDIQALLFDVDGTIADTEELHRLCFNQAFLRSGVDWQWDQNAYAGLMSVPGGPERIQAYVDELDVPATEKDRLRAIVPYIHRAKTEEYARRLQEGHILLRPGIRRLMEEASAAGLPIACVSSSAWDNVGTLIAKAFQSSPNIKIEAMVGGEMVQRRKPAPDIYQLVVRMLRIPPEACVAFEDSSRGVVSARAAGVRVVATPTRWTAGQDFSAADIVLPSLGDPDAAFGPEDAARAGGARWVSLAALNTLTVPPDKRASG